MEMAILKAEPSLKKIRKKKQKKRGNASRGESRSCDPYEGNASKENAVPEESPVKICLNLEPEGGQSHSKIILLREKNEKGWKKKHNDLQYGEASGISVLNVLNVKLTKNEEETSVSANAELCSADGKENSLVPEESDGRGTDMIERDDEHTETIDHLAQPGHVDIQRMKKRKRRRKRRRSLKSPKRSLESNMEDGKKIPLLGCLHEVETTSHLKNIATAEVMNCVLLEEVSIDCSVSENTELCSANTKESSMVLPFSNGSMDGENAKLIKKDNDCLKAKDCLSQLSSDDTHGIAKRGRKIGRRKRKFADSLLGSLESDVEDGKKDTPFNCLIEVETTSLHEHPTTTESVKNVLLEEVSIDHKIADFPSGIEERVDPNLLRKILENEMKTQINKQKVPHLLDYGATNDDIGAVLENNSYSQISDSSKERDAIGCSKKKLLILDVNGLLVDFVPYFPDGYTPDIIISNKAVFKRPFCDDFLQFCFERFEVGVWSSRTWKNLNRLINFLIRDSKHKLLFCWDQSHCTTTRFTTIENNKKPLVLKELKKIWENLYPNLPWKKGEYNESNTLLLDDSPYKALRNPANTGVFPASYRYKDSADTSLGPGGDLRVYLEGLSMAENVQKYVEQNPFGQEPISESNPSWKFYCKIINSEEER